MGGAIPQATAPNGVQCDQAGEGVESLETLCSDQCVAVYQNFVNQCQGNAEIMNAETKGGLDQLLGMCNMKKTVSAPCWEAAMGMVGMQNSLGGTCESESLDPKIICNAGCLAPINDFTSKCEGTAMLESED